MPVVKMNELQRAIRGAQVTVGSAAGGVPPHILGMSTCVRTAVQKVHQVNPGTGTGYIRSKLAHYVARSGSANAGHRATATAAQHYVDAVDTCAKWHTSSGATTKQWQLAGLVQLSPSDAVETIVRAVVENPSTGELTGRIIIWDSLPVSAAAAEVMAAPAIALIDTTYPNAVVAGIEVWQCFKQPVQQHIVAAHTARAAFSQAAAFVASM